MTSNRRRKVEIRTHQAATGVPYSVARRQIIEPTPGATPPLAVTGRVNVLPPLATWTRANACQWWASMSERHGPLIALTISKGDRWWELDDLATELDRPARPAAGGPVPPDRVRPLAASVIEHRERVLRRDHDCTALNRQRAVHRPTDVLHRCTGSGGYSTG